ILESLPDSFRYDRRVPAYGINCGVEITPTGSLRTTDTISVDRERPRYWSLIDTQPDFSFETLSNDPLPSLRRLLEYHAHWGELAWSTASLKARADRDSWSEGMMSEAMKAAEEFRQENARLGKGLRLLESM